MFCLGFWQQKRAESFGGSWQGAARSDLSLRVPKAYEAGISTPPEIMGGGNSSIINALSVKRIFGI